MALFSGGERGVELAQGEINLGECVPRLEGLGRGRGRARELGEGVVSLADGKVSSGVFDQGLKFVVGHEEKDQCEVRREKRKDGLCGPS